LARAQVATAETQALRSGNVLDVARPAALRPGDMDMPATWRSATVPVNVHSEEAHE